MNPPLDTANIRPLPGPANEESNGQFRKAANTFIAFLVAYVIVRGLAAATAKPLWLDELQTLVVAGQPTIHSMWAALSHLIDSQPLGFHILEHASLGLSGSKEIALRLPSILAFACSVVCVYLYVRIRTGELVACVCAFLLLLTSLFQVYLIEARAYSVTVACIAFALICYERLPSLPWATMLAISLILAESLHYYAIFAMIPFWLSEGVLLLKTRRFRWPAWIALACGVFPLIIFWPWLVKFRGYYGTHFFARPFLSTVPAAYGSYFLTDGTFGSALAMVAAVAIIWSAFRSRLGFPDNESNAPAKKILLLALIALPLIALVLLRWTHGGFTDRYLLATSIGIVVGFSYVLYIAGRKATVIFAIFILSVVGIREFRFWQHPDSEPFLPYASASSSAQLQRIDKLLEGSADTGLPIVVSNPLLYTQLVYYVQPLLSERLLYISDEQKELRYSGTDTNVKILLVLRDFFPAEVEDYSQFTVAHRKFLFYAEGVDWQSRALKEDGASIELLRKGEGELYLVKMDRSTGR